MCSIKTLPNLAIEGLNKSCISVDVLQGPYFIWQISYHLPLAGSCVTQRPAYFALTGRACTLDRFETFSRNNFVNRMRFKQLWNLYYTYYAKKGRKLIVCITLDFNLPYCWGTFMILLQRRKRLLSGKGRKYKRLCQHSVELLGVRILGYNQIRSDYKQYAPLDWS
jgi:hypothetical protein